MTAPCYCPMAFADNFSTFAHVALDDLLAVLE